MKKKATKHCSKTVLNFILYFAAAAAFLFIFGSSFTRPFRDTVFADILLDLIISVPLLYFTWIHKKAPERREQIISSCAVSLFFIDYAIPSDKIFIVILTVALIALAGYLLYRYIVHWEKSKILSWEFLIIFFTLFYFFRRYSFANMPKALHFWEFSLVVGALAAIAFLILIIKKVIEYNSVLSAVFTFLGVFFVGFVLAWVIATNMNYALDTSAPSSFVAVVEDKETSSSSKSVSRYLILKIGGEKIRIEVNRDTYMDSNVGDTVDVELHYGAFKDPFYMLTQKNRG